MITDVVVVVPAADEEDEIGGCLESLAAAALLAPSVRTHVVVVLDACVDGTASVVARYAGVSSVISSARCVGTARRLGAEYALDIVGVDGVWLAGTDADCRVPSDWLASMVALADSRADVVVGTVRPGPGLPDAVAATWRRAHDVTDGHPHVHGANLGIRAETYVQLGGWRDLPLHEDVDLVDRAVAAGRTVVRTAAAPVLTSSRLSGRAPGGFAAHLLAMHAPAEGQPV